MLKTSVLHSLLLVSMPALFCFGLTNLVLRPFATRSLKATEFEHRLQEGLTSLGFGVARLDVSAGTALTRYGDTGDCACFILLGQAMARINMSTSGF